MIKIRINITGARMKMRSKLVVSFLQIAVLFYFPIAFGSEVGKTGSNSIPSMYIVPRQGGGSVWVHSFRPNISIAYPGCWDVDSMRYSGSQEHVSFSPSEFCKKSSLGRWNIVYGDDGDQAPRTYEKPKRLSKKIKLNGVRVNFRELVDYSEDGDPAWLAQFKCGDALETIRYFRDKSIEPKKHVVPDVLKLAVKGFRCKK